MPKRVLCTADLHIGRESSGFPGCDALGAWQRLVEQAIAASADAVLVAGDFFDSDAAQYASRMPVVRTLERLRDAGVPVLAVAGNHDSHALRIFSRQAPGLLTVLDIDNLPATVELDGFRVSGVSFQRPDDRRLLERFPEPTTGLPVIGLLHGDIDGQDPRYNPFSAADLVGRGVDAWVLGHIHARRVFTQVNASYPGSPQALDPAETGLHGFHWLEIDDRGRVSKPEFQTLSDVRYEALTVILEAGETIDDAVSRAASAFDDFSGKLGLRLHLRWRHSAPSIPEGDIEWNRGTFRVVSTAPVLELDLPSMARLNDGRGQAARLLLGLDGLGEPDWCRRADGLVQRLEEQMNAVRNGLRVGADERFRLLHQTDEAAAREAIRGSLLAVVNAEEA